MRSAIIGFTLGILLLQQQAQLGGWSALIGLSFLAAFLFYIRSNIKKPLIHCVTGLLAGGLVGWVWASGYGLVGLSQQLDPALEEKEITVIGVVTSLPSQVEYGQRFQFLIERVLTPTIQRQQLPNKVLLALYNEFPSADESANDKFSPIKKAVIHPGDRWQFKVRLRRPHGLANPHGFDYEVWMLEQGLGATGSIKKDIENHLITSFVFTMRHGIEWVREKCRDRILSQLPGKHYAPVLVALVIGDQSAIPTEDWTVFARTGVSHLIAISGLHITLISGMFASLMFTLWRHSFFTKKQLPLLFPAQKVAALSGAIMALVYVALAGFGVPAQRTLIMLSVAAFAQLSNRTTNVTNVLCFALGAVLLVDPWAVMSPGFWLSFSAVGFLFYVGLGRSRIKHRDPHGNLIFVRTSFKQQFLQQQREASVTQYAITVGLVPLTMLLFNQVSLVSPIANAVAIPLVSLLVTPFALVGSVLPMPLGTWLLALTHFILDNLFIFLAWLSEFSWAVWQLPRPDSWMFICALVGTFWCLAPKGWPLRWAGFLTWLPLCLNSSAYPKANEFKVTALDIGQGMAVLVETEGHRLLYDTGPAYSADSDAGRSVIYPYLKMRGINHLDGLMISHSDNDHAGGAMTLLQQIRFGWVSSSLDIESQVVKKAAQVSRHTRCIAGQTWVWDGVQFEVLHPSEDFYEAGEYRKAKPNTKSCTLKISKGGQSILLAGDIEAKQEKELVNTIPEKLPATVLFAPHHGSGTSSTVEFLNAVNPKLALFQLGYHNRYHHPKPSVWERYAELGIDRIRSDDVGAITVHFMNNNGEKMHVEKYRQSHARYWYAVQSQEEK